MNIPDAKLKALLLKQHYVTEDDLKKADKFARDHHTNFLEYLETEGLLTGDLLGNAISEAVGIPYADLNSRPPQPTQVLKIDEVLAKQYRIVIFQENQDSIVFATDTPLGGAKTPAEISALFPTKKMSIAYCLPQDLDTAFLNYRKPLETRFSEIIKTGKTVASEILEQIFVDAISFKASDIHLEPTTDDILVRFRVDGILHEAGRLPKESYPTLINRIKILANLRIDDHFSAQDGAIRYEHDKQFIDMRVSIAPTLNGETIVIRLLGSYVQNFNFGSLGLSGTDQTKLKQTAKKPFGMILVTGPTGSGKSTTLYAILKYLNRPDINIITIEDPVEYKTAGINQIQVNQQTNLTFAKGLRSIIRQDPNIILVGEIRDPETAEIAVNAALTGHLLLSTFHANDASTAIPRLLDMKIEPFLLASTLEFIVSQRLVRKICEACRQSRAATPLEKQKTGISTVYHSKGCPICNNTGFKGRMAIFEIIEATQEMRDLILTRPSVGQIWTLAQKQGARSLYEDGIEKVKNGITTLEELNRVATPPKIYQANKK